MKSASLLRRPCVYSALPFSLLMLVAAQPAGAQFAQTPVATSGTAAPGMPGGANFTSFGFRAPAIENGGNVAFATAVSGGGVAAGNDEGLWLGQPGSLSLVLREGDAAAGAPVGLLTGGLIPVVDNPPALSGARAAAYSLLTGAGVTAANDTALHSNAGGSFSVICREGDQAPGLPAGVLFGLLASSNANYAMNAAGRSVFPNTLSGAGITTANDVSLWSHTSAGGLELVAREGDQAHDFPAGVLLGTLGASSAMCNAAGEIAFLSSLTGPGITTANDTAIWLGTPGSFVVAVQKGDVAAGMASGVTHSSLPSLLALGVSGQIAFGGSLNGVPAALDSATWAGAPGSFRVVAQEGMPVPGLGGAVNFSIQATSNGLKMAGNEWTGLLSFLRDGGVVTATDTALCVSNPTGLDVVAREGDAVPGAPAGVLFGQIGTNFGMNSSGQVIFVNTLTGPGVTVNDDTAIFASDAFGRVRMLLREGTAMPITGPGDIRTPSGNSHTIANSCGSSQDGRRAPINDSGLAVYATTLSTGSAIMRADLSDVEVDSANGLGADFTLADGIRRRVPDDLLVGLSTTGNSLTIGGGTSVTVADGILVAGPAGSGGTLNLNGAATTLTGSFLVAGSQGQAAVNLSSEARVLTAFSSIGHANIQIDNATWRTLNGDFNMGGATNPGSAGTLGMTNGGILMVAENFFAPGNTVSLSGNGTALTAGTLIRLNETGTGSFTVNSGAAVTSPLFLAGFGLGISSSVSVNGAGSSIVSSANCVLGINGSVTTAISGGGLIQGQEVAVASQTGTSTVTINGGTLRSNAALVIGGDTTFGAGGGTAAVTVNGGGSAECATLIIHSGDSLTLNGGTLKLNTLVPGSGALNWNAGTVDFGAAMTADSATLTRLLGAGGVLSGGRTLKAATLTLTAPLIVDGGTLAVDTIINPGLLTFRSGRIETNALLVSPSGLLGGNLTVDDDSIIAVTQSGGLATIAPGNRLTLAGGELLATTVLNNGELRLSGDAFISGNDVSNFGVLRGTGYIGSMLLNQGSGQVRVRAGEELIFSGAAAHTNSGTLDVVEGALEFRAPLTNSSSGMIFARDASLAFGGGLTNAGSMALSFGICDVYGDISNQAGGQIVLSGGGMATFVDDVNNAGTLRVSAGAQAVFFGTLSGNGVAGSGTVFAEGDLRPGFSPGLMSFGGDLTLGMLTELTMEIGGRTAGVEYDRLSVSGALTRDGTLQVALINGFVPAAGDQFLLFDAANAGGTFTVTSLPPLPGGLFWRTSRLYTHGILGVSNVPDTFAEYAAFHGLTGGSAGDEDGDGAGNGLEYLFGTSPVSPSSIPVSSSLTGDTLTFSFDAPVLPGSDAVYLLETSPDLTTWANAATRTGEGAWTGPGAAGISIVPAGAGLETVTFTRTGAESRLFVRLRANQ